MLPPLNAPDDPLSAAVRAQLFLALLATGHPIPVAAVGAPAGIDVAAVRQAIDALVSAGRVTVTDGMQAVTGSLGLSVVPCRHRLDLPLGRRYTWCALDAVGVFGALRTTGSITSTTPRGERVMVRLSDGRPVGAGTVVVLIPERGPGPTVHSWCPLVNFFLAAEHARDWSDENDLPAAIVPVREVTSLGTELWRDAIAAASGLGPWTAENSSGNGEVVRLS